MNSLDCRQAGTWAFYLHVWDSTDTSSHRLVACAASDEASLDWDRPGKKRLRTARIDCTKRKKENKIAQPDSARARRYLRLATKACAQLALVPYDLVPRKVVYLGRTNVRCPRSPGIFVPNPHTTGGRFSAGSLSRPWLGTRIRVCISGIPTMLRNHLAARARALRLRKAHAGPQGRMSSRNRKTVCPCRSSLARPSGEGPL